MTLPFSQNATQILPYAKIAEESPKRRDGSTHDELQVCEGQYGKKVHGKEFPWCRDSEHEVILMSALLLTLGRYKPLGHNNNYQAALWAANEEE